MVLMRMSFFFTNRSGVSTNHDWDRMGFHPTLKSPTKGVAMG
jgi:hypothetical protein